jgi:hypothetical protein
MGSITSRIFPPQFDVYSHLIIPKCKGKISFRIVGPFKLEIVVSDKCVLVVEIVRGNDDHHIRITKDYGTFVETKKKHQSADCGSFLIFNMHLFNAIGVCVLHARQWKRWEPDLLQQGMVEYADSDNSSKTCETYIHHVTANVRWIQVEDTQKGL